MHGSVTLMIVAALNVYESKISALEYMMLSFDVLSMALKSAVITPDNELTSMFTKTK